MAQFHDWREEYPFASRLLDLGGVRMHYVDEGPALAVKLDELTNSAETLLCVHGNPTWSFFYRKIVAGLRNRHRVLAVDHIGCGMSDRPRRYDYCLRTHADNLSDFINRLDLRDITLVVHDWGGPIGVAAALRDPVRIARLVILNTGLFPPTYVPLRIRAMMTPWIGGWAIERLNLFAGPATSMAISGKCGPLSGAAKAGLLAPYLIPRRRLAIRRFVADIPLSPRHRTWPELEAVEAGLNTFADRPALILWGMRDWCFRPQCLDRIAGHFPRAEIHRIEDAGHYLMEDAGEEVVERIGQWLKR